MGPPRHLDDGSLNPAWVEWADQTLVALAESAGVGLEIGKTGIQLDEPTADAHWVELIRREEVAGVYRYSFREVRKSSGVRVRIEAGAYANAELDWAEEANNQAVDVPMVVLVRRDTGHRWLFQAPVFFPETSGSGGSVSFTVPTNIRCDPETEDIIWDTVTYRILLVNGNLIVDVVE